MPRYDTHLLNLEEVWYAREHPFDITVVATKRAVRVLEAAQVQERVAREMLEKAVAAMNVRRKAGA